MPTKGQTNKAIRTGDVHAFHPHDGERSLQAAGATMTTDTIFNIASMTKPMTSVGAL
jgi:CubicO group peptidase (beta-lactamase class C family)